MTYVPDPLAAWQRYMTGATGLPAVSLGTIGSAGHHATGTSYHIGWSSLRTDAYSRQHRRDTRLRTDAASASDTGYGARFSHARLVELTMWAVAEARAGRRPDTREIIGPWSDGRAYRFDALGGWKAAIRPRGDSHETHMHESWWRDSEHRDKIQHYRPFFDGGRGEESGMALPVLGDKGGHVAYWQRRLNRLGAKPELKIDGDYGPATQIAVTASRKAYGYQSPDREEITGWHAEQMDADVARLYAGKDGRDGKDGEPGRPGEQGPPGELQLPSKITGSVTGTVKIDVTGTD